MSLFLYFFFFFGGGYDTSRVTGFVAQLPRRHRPTTSRVSMGLLDDLLPNFLKQREGDFVPLQETDDVIVGPGPLLLTFGLPAGITLEELYDMVEDGMSSNKKQAVVARVVDSADGASSASEGCSESLLDLTVQEALDTVMKQHAKRGVPTTDSNLEAQQLPSFSNSSPILYFSGFTNKDMMSCYNIIAQEVYQETQGRIPPPACAKVVPPALLKSLRQVFEEVSGDHLDAMSADPAE